MLLLAYLVFCTQNISLLFQKVLVFCNAELHFLFPKKRFIFAYFKIDFNFLFSIFSSLCSI